MFKNTKNKLLVWREILLWPSVKIVGAITTIHLIDWLLEKFAPIWWEKGGIEMIMSSLSWQIWVIIGLIGLIFLTLESAYRLISNKEADLDRLRIEQRNDSIFMSLKEAVQQLYDNCISRVLCKQFIDGYIKGENTPSQDVWKSLAELFFRCTTVPVHGKDVYSGKLIKLILDENYINNMDFDDNVSLLKKLIGNEVKYTDLSIKSNEVDKAISEIINTIEETRRGDAYNLLIN